MTNTIITRHILSATATILSHISSRDFSFQQNPKVVQGRNYKQHFSPSPPPTLTLALNFSYSVCRREEKKDWYGVDKIARIFDYSTCEYCESRLVAHHLPPPLPPPCSRNEKGGLFICSPLRYAVGVLRYGIAGLRLIQTSAAIGNYCELLVTFLAYRIPSSSLLPRETTT